MRDSVSYIMIIGVAVSAIAVFLFGTVWTLTKGKNNDTNTLVGNKSIPTSYHFQIDSVPTDEAKIQYTV